MRAREIKEMLEQGMSWQQVFEVEEDEVAPWQSLELGEAMAEREELDPIEPAWDGEPWVNEDGGYRLG
jgi:hypothetical protein